MVLSICFTVYNQIDILREQLDEISRSHTNEVEVIISDDCSTDDIESCVLSYSDDRFRYYRTPKNLGHDLNILFAIEKARSNYVMILRTRDNIKHESIEKIINEINLYPEAAYYLFSAEYKNKPRLYFPDRIYIKGDETCKAHFLLPEHPSGNIYNKKFLNTELYRKYINTYFDNTFGFIVHSLIRCDLSQKADFRTSSVVGWIYTDTLDANDKAVNRTRNGINVYAPEYCFPRFKCELLFIKNEVLGDQICYFKGTIKKNYSFVIGRAITISKDQRYNAHYSSKKHIYHRRTVGNALDQILSENIIDLPRETQKQLLIYSRKMKIKYTFLYPIKEKVRNILIFTPVYSLYRSAVRKKRIEIK